MNEKREEQDIIDLGTLLWNFLRGLKKGWWLIPLLALLGGAAGYVRSIGFYTPMYRSSASFTVMTGGTNTDTGGRKLQFLL